MLRLCKFVKISKECMEVILETTSKRDKEIARVSVAAFGSPARILRKESGVAKIKIKESGDFIKIPQTALKLLFIIIQNMADGKSITLIPSGAEVSTQQAADMLNVSRPHLVKLLEERKIPFKKVGAHRRIELNDIIEYDRKLSQTRNEQLDFLAKQAQELNLGY